MELTPHTHSWRLHFLLCEGLPHFAIMRVDCVVFLDCVDWEAVDELKHTQVCLTFLKIFVLTDNPVNWVVVIKSDKGEPPLLPSIAICHDVNDFNCAKLLEVVTQLRFFCVFFDASNKDLFHCYVGPRTVWILWSEKSRHSTLLF